MLLIINTDNVAGLLQRSWVNPHDGRSGCATSRRYDTAPLDPPHLQSCHPWQPSLCLNATSIHCWTPENSHKCNTGSPPSRSANQPPPQQPSVPGPNQPLTVCVGAALYSALTAASSPPTDATLAGGHMEAPTYGVELRLRSMDSRSSAVPPSSGSSVAAALGPCSMTARHRNMPAHHRTIPARHHPRSVQTSTAATGA